MRLKLYQVDAFSTKSFAGNPAAVVPLKAWLSDKLMQAIAEENNLSETAFYISNKNGFSIRWFTPTKEVELCGHATLAAAFVIFNALNYEKEAINFNSLSGVLSVVRKGDVLTLDFPAQVPKQCNIPDALIEGLGIVPLECLKNEDFIAVLDSEEDVAAIKPNYSCLEKLDLRGVIITAPTKKNEFVCRFFAPKYGIDEDAVTGSAYTQLVPYWAEKLGSNQFFARQISRRGGELTCELVGCRVLISGWARQHMEGWIDV